ncbi:uncharacterized protein LOC141493216 [Macrotis lagotis]|uniref:uncharacterized protein LOC141493216 n=1 Tax=Macrotis lagotis TaxID=92651 RepID=UPI003D680890
METEGEQTVKLESRNFKRRRRMRPRKGQEFDSPLRPFRLSPADLPQHPKHPPFNVGSSFPLPQFFHSSPRLDSPPQLSHAHFQLIPQAGELNLGQAPSPRNDRNGVPAAHRPLLGSWLAPPGLGLRLRLRPPGARGSVRLQLRPGTGARKGGRGRGAPGWSPDGAGAGGAAAARPPSGPSGAPAGGAQQLLGQGRRRGSQAARLRAREAGTPGAYLRSPLPQCPGYLLLGEGTASSLLAEMGDFSSGTGKASSARTVRACALHADFPVYGHGARGRSRSSPISSKKPSRTSPTHFPVMAGFQVALI